MALAWLLRDFSKFYFKLRSLGGRVEYFQGAGVEDSGLGFGIQIVLPGIHAAP